MIRLLPFILIPVVVLAALGYWRYVATKPSLEIPETVEFAEPVEVPKTLPGATTEDRVNSLEETLLKLVTQVNNLNSSSSKQQTSTSLDTRLGAAEAAVTELKARVSSLEKATPVSVSSSSKSTVYIPLGSGGQLNDQSWTTLSTFQISLDPAQYPGYTNMQLEVTMRLNQPGGTLYARLYNTTAGSATSSETSTTATTAQLVSSSAFTLLAGSKTYVLQAKISDGTLGFLDYARIKVNF